MDISSRFRTVSKRLPIMKLLLVLVLIGAVTAEPPRYRSRFSQRQEQAPYPPSGYRPIGEQLRLPSRQQNLPVLYGPPPEETTTTEATTDESTETEADTTTVSPLSTQVKQGKQKDNLKEADEVEEVQETNPQEEQQGVYYILLPTGQLQRVQYFTNANAANMVYSTRLQYQNVEPIRGPIYAFRPNSPVLQLVL